MLDNRSNIDKPPRKLRDLFSYSYNPVYWIWRWRWQTGCQLKPWATTIKADLELPSQPQVVGYARWDWVKISCERAQDRRA